MPLRIKHSSEGSMQKYVNLDIAAVSSHVDQLRTAECMQHFGLYEVTMSY